ncbi:complex I intermediate-associated protein 30-domain-containing protein [Aspergillus avenaceus]|uniref:Complex I intermediate-associated protein 30-domain-containing protein n=1 Tax=Aspergillus avenaceus TaxID=36643 RepID=A0A5N6U3F9_ASPAV|nr:complex I intermediate-associated protein 30-domain-containing protein [Aspergillus avenaceus]
MDAQLSHLPLFGGPKAWHASDWTSTDDRVRGGSSQSELTCSPSSLVAKFHGNLDITTLGGAGFASQRTKSEKRKWNLSSYDGIELNIAGGDGKLYTLNIKDEIAPKRPDGRQESALVWEYDFRADGAKKVYIKWDDLRPTYRGKEQGNVRPLDLKKVKQVSIMIRSFFGKQEGEFQLDIVSISAFRVKHYRDDPEDEDYEIIDDKMEDDVYSPDNPKRQGWLSWFGGCCGLT